jgi:hypothetical protein
MVLPRWFLNTFGIVSFIRFRKWIISIVSTLISYYIRPYSTSNCVCPWHNPPLNHDQTFRWNSSYYMGETLYQFTSRFLCFQFRDAFATHFSPHQFKVAIKGGYETIIHGIKCTSDFHPDWVVLQLELINAFNSVSRGVIFQKLRVIGGDIIRIIPFVRAFYAFESSLFYIIVIMKAMLQSSHMSWGLMKVIPWEGHYSF